MKVLLDTNVLIAALISRGVCSDLLEHCFLHHTIVTSHPLLEELRDQLINKFKYGTQEADEAVSLLQSQMSLVPAPLLQQPVCRDPDDDVVLATAIEAIADCIITGDKDLLILQKYQNVVIVRPSDFADFEAKGRGP